MKIIFLDNDKNQAKNYIEFVRNAHPGAEITIFDNPDEALDYVQNNQCDVAFIRAFPDMNPIEIALKLQDLRPQLNIIFAVENDELAQKAFQIHASGYLIGDITDKEIASELSNLRYAPEAESTGHITIRTFGNFEVYHDSRPLKLSKKSKELFAYLVDRSGALVSNNEIYGILYEDEPGHMENLKKIKKSLVDSLHAAGCDDVLIVQRGMMAVNPDAVDCDYYNWKQGKPGPQNTYSGEYMSQYSWAEYSISEMDD